MGPSRCGKSTAQLVGASALGFGTEESLPTLNATVAGLLATALAFNDHMLPINEVGTAAGSKGGVWPKVYSATYALTSGKDIIRHPSWTEGGRQGSFQVLCLLSSEHTPDEWAGRYGETRDAGETARLIGVPVLQNGATTIFDRPPGGLKDAALTAWVSEQFECIKDELPHSCGYAFPAFIDRLVQDRDAQATYARKVIQAFENRFDKQELTEVRRDIIAKFGILAAGGAMASAFKVLLIDEKVIFDAVIRACNAALSVLPDPDAELREDLASLQRNLGEGAILDAEAISARRMSLFRQADGFHCRRDKGAIFVVRQCAFASWFRTPLRAQRVLERIDLEGFLPQTRERRAGRSLDWAQKQVTWPDGTRVRSISIYLPGGLEQIPLR